MIIEEDDRGKKVKNPKRPSGRKDAFNEENKKYSGKGEKRGGFLTHFFYQNGESYC